MYGAVLQIQVAVCGSQTCEHTAPVVVVSQVCDWLSLSLSTRTASPYVVKRNTNCHLPVPLLHQALVAPWHISTCTTLPPTPAPIPVAVAVSHPTHRPNPYHMSDAVSSHCTQAVLQLQPPRSPTSPVPHRNTNRQKWVRMPHPVLLLMRASHVMLSTLPENTV